MSEVATHRAPNGTPTPLSPGRPRGARNLLSKAIIEDLSEVWQTGGIDALRVMSKGDPARFAQLAVSILPKDVLVSVEQVAPGGLSVEDWASIMRVLDLIKLHVPADADAGPSEVFTVIETALRAHFATDATPRPVSTVDMSKSTPRKRDWAAIKRRQRARKRAEVA